MFCGHCGNEVSDNAKFCGGCGQTMAGAGIPQTPYSMPGTKKKGNKAKGIIILLIILLILLVLTLGILLMYKNGLFDSIFSSGDTDVEDEDWDEDDREDDDEGDDDRGKEGDEDGPEAGGTAEVTPQPTPEPAPEPTPQPTPEPTPTPVAGNEIHSYQFIVADITWSEAAQRCRDNGGYLVNINSPEEYAHIISLISDYNLEDVIWWLGGCRQDGSNNYTWILENGYMGSEILNGDTKYSHYWLSGEPSFGNEQVKEQYMTMFYHASDSCYVWNDVPNDIISIAPFYAGKIGYICEYNDDSARETMGYVLPASSYRYLEESELWGLNAEQCRIARNEIFARHGRKFSDAGLQAYFDACYWYKGTIEPDAFDSAVLNEFEVYNRDLIVEYEKKMGYR